MLRTCNHDHPLIAFSSEDWPTATALGLCPLCAAFRQLEAAGEARSALKRERAVSETLSAHIQRTEGR